MYLLFFLNFLHVFLQNWIFKMTKVDAFIEQELPFNNVFLTNCRLREDLKSLSGPELHQTLRSVLSHFLCF